MRERERMKRDKRNDTKRRAKNAQARSGCEQGEEVIEMHEPSK